MRNPIITLLTDFGQRDHYVASMKGVILSVNPRCTLIDITHQIKPHDIMEGAFILTNAYSFFPKGTIHLAVIDPGVGGPRKPILLVTRNYFFIGPDNGVFTFVVKKEGVKKIVALTNSTYFLPHISTTFQGRDLFAPVAGHLSMGVRPDAFGKEIDVWKEIEFRNPKLIRGKLTGEVLHIDHFGNLITNINEQEFFHFTENHPFVIKVGERAIKGLRKGYWEGKKNEAIALIGSGGFLEVSIREGSAQKVLGVKKGDRIEVQNLKSV